MLRNSNESLQPTLFMPPASWRIPDRFPTHLIQSREPIAVDTETYDPLLIDRGPSWRYGRGHIAGICLASENHQWYFPVGHLGGGNMDKSAVFRFFHDLLNQPGREIRMANAPYDLGWLVYEGILNPQPHRWGFILDILLTEALINEEHPAGYSLEALSLRYLKRRKDESALREVAKELGLDPKKDLWKFPAKYVGSYGEMDARNTWDIFPTQRERICKEDLQQVWQLEMDLIPVFHAMTRQGIPFNSSRADELNTEILKEEQELTLGVPCNVWTPEETAKALQQEGFKLPRTESGNYSTAKDVLRGLADYDKLGNPLNLPARILDLRKVSRLRETYVVEAANWVYAGRVYPEFLQIATDEGGARSGRCASKNPNFQQVPKRSKLGKMIRSLYHCGTDSKYWAKLDYSSQEPRWQVHYGLLLNLRGAEEVRDSFLDGKKLYTWMEENIPGLTYDDAKMLVLARSYGMGLKTFRKQMNLAMEEAVQLLEQFDRSVPYIGLLAKATTAKAGSRGYIQTVLKRRRRFLYWENPDEKDKTPIYGYTAARKRWPEDILRRAYTHKAFNALIQGSSADQTKVALLNIYRQLNKVPYATVHDEIDLPVDNLEQAKAAAHLMEEAIPNTLCPFKVDIDLGKTWQ